MAKLGGIYIDIRGRTAKLAQDFKKAKGMAKKTAVLMKHELGKIDFGDLKFKAIAAGAALGAMTLKVVSLGREFESTMKTVQAWSGAVGDELKGLTDIAREMGATTEHTATQAAEALKFLAAAGFSAKKSIGALPGTLNLATAGQVDLATATDITTDVLTAFGMGVDELNRVNDAFITTTSNSNTNVMMLGQSMKMAAPTAKLFGLTIEQTAAMIGTLANAGIKAEMAGSGLNMVLLKSARAAKKLGLEAGTPLVDVLRKMKDEQWGAVKVGEAFGARQVKTAAILMDNIDAFEKLEEKIIDNVGATEELAKVIRDSLDVDIKTLVSTIEEELLRVFDEYKDHMRDVVQSTTEWIRQNPEAIDQIAKMSKNMFDLFTVMAKIVGIGVEFSNVWVDTFRAMGIASTGMISWHTALTDGVAAVEMMSTEIGVANLRLNELQKHLKFLEDSPALPGIFGKKRREEIAKTNAEIKLVQSTIAALQKTISAAKIIPTDVSYDIDFGDPGDGLTPTIVPTIDTAAVDEDLKKIRDMIKADPFGESFDIDFGVDKVQAGIDNILIARNNERLALEQNIDLQNRMAEAVDDTFLDNEAFVENLEERFQIQDEFNQKSAELGLSKFDLERLQVERMAEIYEQAGVERVRIEEMTAKRLAEISRAETEQKISDIGTVASSMAAGFKDISEMGIKSSKEAFIAYKAFKLVEIGIATRDAAIKAYGALVGIPFVGPALAVGAATAAIGFGLAQASAVASAQPPSFDQGGISRPGEIYQTGPIRELHIPMSGKNAVDLGGGGDTININLPNATFLNKETLDQSMIQIATIIATKVAPGAVVKNYRDDGPIRQMVKGGI